MEQTSEQNIRRLPSRACRKKNENIKFGTDSQTVQNKNKKDIQIISENVRQRNCSVVLVKENFENREKTKFDGKMLYSPSPQQIISENVRQRKLSVVLLKENFENREKTKFDGRFEWIKDHSDKPLTSTPVFATSKIFSHRDVQSCFGFDNSNHDENETPTNLISPICLEKGVNIPPICCSPLKPTNINVKDQLFSSLLVRYGMLEEKKSKKLPFTDGQVTHKTYAIKKKVNVGLEKENMPKKTIKKVSKLKSCSSINPTQLESESKPEKQQKPPKSKRQKKIDNEVKKWMEEKNLEFENITNFPLFVE